MKEIFVVMVSVGLVTVASSECDDFAVSSECGDCLLRQASLTTLIVTSKNDRVANFNVISFEGPLARRRTLNIYFWLPPLRMKSQCGYDEEKSNDEKHNRKYDPSTEINPDLEVRDTVANKYFICRVTKNIWEERYFKGGN
ncbi:hypothetical protein TNCV_2023731 [Trichonephila clavipes]|nr:hypothetical protein TNCV_2023731 [Trichonephila clavipes]